MNLGGGEAAFTSRYVAIFLTPPFGYPVTSQVKVGGQSKVHSGGFSFLRTDCKKWAPRWPLFSGPFPPTTWGQAERLLLGETSGPWRRAHSHGKSPSFILKWEMNWSGPCGVAQAPALFTGSGLTVRPHQPACGNLHCTFKSCFSWFQEPYFFFSKLLLTFHLFSETESQSPRIDILSNSRRGPPGSQASPQGHPSHFHQLLLVSGSWCKKNCQQKADSFPFIWKTKMKTNIQLSDDLL